MRVCRVVFTGDDPTDRQFSLANKGRFHDDNWPGKRTSYTACEQVTAESEVLSHSPEVDLSQFSALEIELRCEVLDLTDGEVQKEWRINRKSLIGPHEPCQELGRRLRAHGIPAILTYSAADQPDGRCVVVFEECLRSKSQFRIVNVRTLSGASRPAPKRSRGSGKSAKPKASRKKS